MYECPQCHSDHLAVEYVSHGELFIDGDGNAGDYSDGHFEWGVASGARCCDCGHAGTVEDFEIGE